MLPQPLPHASRQQGPHRSGPSAERISALLARLLEGEGVEDDAGLSIEIADDELLHELNREHRGVDGPTDELSRCEGSVPPATCVSASCTTIPSACFGWRNASFHSGSESS